jgi:methylated-DNA-protein-cysteine methyltransferase-like protein
MTGDPFQQRVVSCIKKIPKGKVATYGLIAAMAGNSRAARQVVRALHASSTKEALPWHRVVNAKGEISLPKGSGYEEQAALLESEGVTLSREGRIDLKKYLWTGPRR